MTENSYVYQLLLNGVPKGSIVIDIEGGVFSGWYFIYNLSNITPNLKAYLEPLIPLTPEGIYSNKQFENQWIDEREITVGINLLRAVIQPYVDETVSFIQLQAPTPPQPTQTPPELEQQRQTEQATVQKQMAQAEEKTVDADLIESATPDDQKPQGASKLAPLIFALGSQIPQIIEPSIQSLMQKYLPQEVLTIAQPIIQQKKNKDSLTVTEEQRTLVIDQLKALDIDICPSDAVLTQLITLRNDIVQSLNNIGIKIDQLGTSITGTSNFLNTILGIITAVDTASIIASAAAKLLPVTPGAVPAALNDAQTFIRKITFDQQGNSRLSKLSGAISSSALVVSVLSVYILRVKNLLDIIDIYVNLCQLNPNLITTSNAINSLANSQKQAQKTQNQIGYKGFIIEIEEVPYTPTVNRRRAIGKNTEGIVMIQTELSFTTNNQTLINELKYIIDKENLYIDIVPPQYDPLPVTPPPAPPKPPTQETPQQKSSLGDPDPLGYLGKYIGEEGALVLGNGQVEDIYQWEGTKWIYIKTIDLNRD